jgi:hypothetical protein
MAVERRRVESCSSGVRDLGLLIDVRSGTSDGNANPSCEESIEAIPLWPEM